jgi:hypothetical protein
MSRLGRALVNRLDITRVKWHLKTRGQWMRDLLAHHGAADLVTATSDGVVATLLPFVYDREWCPPGTT